jgi:hypothetical protein
MRVDFTCRLHQTKNGIEDRCNAIAHRFDCAARRPFIEHIARAFEVSNQQIRRSIKAPATTFFLAASRCRRSNEIGVGIHLRARLQYSILQLPRSFILSCAVTRAFALFDTLGSVDKRSHKAFNSRNQHRIPRTSRKQSV